MALADSTTVSPADSSGEHRGKKRKDHSSPSTKPTRRALSCTECKRRKTKCSALGQTPCQACINRRKPEACVWENAGEGEGGPDTTLNILSLAQDVNLLKDQVKELRAIIELLRPQRLVPSERSVEDGPQPAATLSSDTSPGIRTGDRPELESTLDSLEISIIGPLPGAKPRASEDAHAVHNPSTPVTSSGYHKLLQLLLLDDAVGSWILDEFFTGPIYQGWYSVEEFAFRAHYEAYRRSTPEQQATADRGWLAIALMILAFVFRLGNPEDIRTLLPFYSLDDIKQLPDELYTASTAALSESDCLISPQIRHIQVCLLYIPFLFHFGKSIKNVNMALRHLDEAITTAQWLGIDWTQGVTASAPLEDPALQYFHPWAANEVCKRIYHMLSNLDGTIMKSLGTWRLDDRAGLERPPLPKNYLDDDLRRSVRPPQQPPSVLTRGTLPRLGSLYASACRQHALRGGESTYAMVLELDRTLRDILSQIVPPSATVPSRESLISHWMMHHLLCSLHSRIMRIHRPYMVKARVQDTFKKSRQASIESAKIIIRTQLLFVDNPRLRPRFVKRWILGSAFVLVLDYILIKQVQWDDGDADTSRRSVLDALSIFRNEDQSDGTASLSQQCARTIDTLLAVAGDLKPDRERSFDETLQVFLEEVKSRLAEPSVTELPHITDVSPDIAQNGFVPDLLSFDMLFPISFDQVPDTSMVQAGEELRDLWDQWVTG